MPLKGMKCADLHAVKGESWGRTTQQWTDNKNKKQRKKCNRSIRHRNTSIYIWCEYGTHHTYGWRKCSKSQALKILTDLSGNPRWGLHVSCSIIPIWLNDLCCLRFRSKIFSLGVSPFVIPDVIPVSLSPRTSHVCFSCAITPSLRHRKCRDMAFWASPVYGLAAPKSITASNEFTIICICSQ